MSIQYGAVGWNRQKKLYDAVLFAAVLLYLIIFMGTGALVHPNATIETLFIRALGTLAFLMLHVILAIGPLCRLDSRFLPLLYNRRHLGVATFIVGLAHGTFSIIQFHALGDLNPLVSLLTANTRFRSLANFPFEVLGLLALLILFLLAATSHDFWLHNLAPQTWKRLHMSVYGAYFLLAGHVVLGALQSETSPWLADVFVLGASAIVSLHLLAGFKEVRRDTTPLPKKATGFVDACEFASIPEGRGQTVAVNGERVAIFRHNGSAFALSNVCRHQGGPLGEGKIIDGCVTCPWHGYQYRPETGASPPPFNDQVPVFETQVIDGRVLVNLCKS